MTEGPRFAELINKIAHELRSPLTSVKGFSSTLIKRWDKFTDEQKREFVETIHFDAERMSRIVSEVLDLARMESGRLELHQANVNLSAMTAGVAESYGNLAGSDRVKLDIPDDLTVWADPDRIGHVVGNLIENAIKFSDDGTILVTAKPTDGDVDLTVTDQGVGIQPEHLPHLFEGPAPSAGKATPLGTGLGLYLSRRLVDAHGGQLTVDSTPGEGSTFTLRLSARAPDD
jgi:signal transduction histidine kinase